MTLESDVSDLWHRYDDDAVGAETATDDDHATLDAFLDALEAGEVRAAEKRGDEWEANEWVTWASGAPETRPTGRRSVAGRTSGATAS